MELVHNRIAETLIATASKTMLQASVEGMSQNLENNAYIVRHDHMYSEHPLMTEIPIRPTEEAQGTSTPKEEAGSESIGLDFTDKCDATKSNGAAASPESETKNQLGYRIIGSIYPIVKKRVKSKEESEPFVQMSEVELMKAGVTQGSSDSHQGHPESSQSSTGERQNCKVKPHICVLCGENFETWQAVSSHLQIHINNYQSQINKSATHFLDTYTLTGQGKGPVPNQSSFKVSRGDSKGGCKPNPQVPNSTNKTYRCSSCDQEFRSGPGLKTHEKYCIESRPYKCKFCNRRYKLHYELSQHVKDCPQCTCKCPVCERGFISSYALKQHMKTHTVEKPHKCSVCGQCFRQIGGYNYHMRTHRGEKLHTCLVCAQRFTQSGSLWRHMMKFHMKHKCSVCRRGFTALSSLQEHILNHGHTTKESYQGSLIHSPVKNRPIHAKKNLYMCPVCKTCCKTMSDVQQHMQVHTNDPTLPSSTMLKAQICDRTTTEPDSPEIVITPRADIKIASVIGAQPVDKPGTVQKANTTETQEKPHQCSECGKRFTLEAALEKHIVTHTGEYKCGLCSQVFTDLTSVTQHMNSHSGKQSSRPQTSSAMSKQALEMPCKCGVCNERFRDVKFLIRHMEVHSLTHTPI